MVPGPISITFQCLEHVFPLSPACTSETSFLCTPVTLQSHVFLSCKSRDKSIAAISFRSSILLSFLWFIIISSFHFAVTTDSVVGVSQFKLHVLLTLSLVWVTNSEMCPCWNKSSLKEVKSHPEFCYPSVYNFWCKWICPLGTLQLATSLLTLSDVASQSSLNFSNSAFEQFVLRIANTKW